MLSSSSIVRRGALSLFALSLSMCTAEGTETDNPVADFDATECKTHPTALSLATVARTRAALDVDVAAYDGLYCYAWETGEGGALTLDVLNYQSGCSITWERGESRIDGDQIDLGIGISRCAIAGCGSCTYDLTFALEGIDPSTAAQVQLRRLGCDGSEDQLEPRLELPIDEHETGIVCRPLRYSGFEQQCGRAHLPPCEGEYMDPSTCEEGVCDEGLLCLSDESGDGDRCFTACEQDDDCPIEVESCQDGACRLRETF